MSLGLRMTCIIFPPFSVSCFGSHRYGKCVFNGLGEGRLWTTSKSGIASRKKNSLTSLVYSVLPLINMHTTSQIQCVPKNKKNNMYIIICSLWDENTCIQFSDILNTFHVGYFFIELYIFGILTNTSS